MNNHANIASIDSEPPLALDKFIGNGVALPSRRLAKHAEHLRPALFNALWNCAVQRAGCRWRVRQTTDTAKTREL